MALEGGYNLNSLANSVEACVEVLLQDKPVIRSLEAYPFASSWRVIQEVILKLSTNLVFVYYRNFSSLYVLELPEYKFLTIFGLSKALSFDSPYSFWAPPPNSFSRSLIQTPHLIMYLSFNLT